MMKKIIVLKSIVHKIINLANGVYVLYEWVQFKTIQNFTEFLLSMSSTGPIWKGPGAHKSHDFVSFRFALVLILLE